MPHICRRAGKGCQRLDLRQRWAGGRAHWRRHTEPRRVDADERRPVERRRALLLVLVDPLRDSGVKDGQPSICQSRAVPRLGRAGQGARPHLRVVAFQPVDVVRRQPEARPELASCGLLPQQEDERRRRERDLGVGRRDRPEEFDVGDVLAFGESVRADAGGDDEGRVSTELRPRQDKGSSPSRLRREEKVVGLDVEGGGAVDVGQVDGEAGGTAERSEQAVSLGESS